MKPNRLRTPQSVDEWAERYMADIRPMKSKKKVKVSKKDLKY